MFGEQQDIDDLERDFAEAQKNDSSMYGADRKVIDADGVPERQDPFNTDSFDSQAEDLKREMAEEKESDDDDDEEESDEEETEESDDEEEKESDEADEGDEEDGDEPEDPSDRKGNKKTQFISQEQFYATQRKLNKTLENIATRIEAIQSGNLTEKQEDKSVEEIQKLAKEYGISEDKLPQFIDALQKQIIAPIAPVIEEIEQQKFVAAEAANDQKEWNDVLPEIQERYPNATPAQLDKARTAMLQLAHSKKYGFTDANHPPMPLDFILFKEQGKFKDIFKAKKKTFESGSRGASERADDEPRGRSYENKSPENYTPKDIEQMEADFNSEVDKADRLTINRDGQKIRVRR
jgi:hypothetical protein